MENNLKSYPLCYFFAQSKPSFLLCLSLPVLSCPLPLYPSVIFLQVVILTHLVYGINTFCWGYLPLQKQIQSTQINSFYDVQPCCCGINLRSSILIAETLFLQKSASPEHDGPSAPAAEQQDDLCYASVSFSKSQEDPLYSNIMPTKPKGQNEEDEEEGGGDVEYSLVKFINGAQG